MAKVNLTDITTGYTSSTAYNANNDLIETAIDNTLSRDGTSPNQMGANLDMNSYYINNIPDAVQNQQPITLAQAATIASVTTAFTQENVGAALYPRTASEISASITPTNYYYPEFDIRRYGATLDGVTDDRTALNNCLAVIAANQGGRLYIPPGSDVVCASALGEISQRSTTNGAFSNYCVRDVEIYAKGSTINYTGSSGSCFNFQGTGFDATDPRRLNIIGGNWIGTANTEAMFKIRDAGRAGIHPESVIGCTAGRAILLQNYYQYSENISISGPDGMSCALVNNLYDINCQGHTEVQAFESVGDQGGTESFARLRVFNIQHGTIATSPSNCHFMLIEGSVYDSFIGRIGGNQSNVNCSALIKMEGGMTRTIISDLHLEGANVDNSITLTGVSVDDFNVGDTIQGGTSSAQGIIRKITGSSPTYTFFYSATSGTFQTAAETISCILPVSSTGVGTKDGNAPAAIADAYIVEATGSGESDQAHPIVINADWTGGDAIVLNGWGDSVTNSEHRYYTNQAFYAPIGEPNWITPTALSGDVNDYEPTGLGLATGIRIDPNGADRTITGLAGGYEGRMITIVNIGALSERLILSDNDTGSVTPSNRFSLVDDIHLVANQAVRLIYDGISNRWRAFIDYAGVPIEETSANLGDSGHAINTTNKYRGKLVWRTDVPLALYRAAGAGSGADWVGVDGTAAITPGP